MKDLNRAIENALTKKMKEQIMHEGIRALQAGYSHDNVRRHCGGALNKIASHVVGSGLCNKQTAASSHKKLQKFIRGKGFFDSIKRFAQKVFGGMKKGYNAIRPLIGMAAPLLKGALALHPMTKKALPFVDIGLDLAEQHLADPPAYEEEVPPPPYEASGSGFISDLAGSFGLGMAKGRGHRGAGSAAAKAKMARVRACKKSSAGALFPGGY